MKKLLIIISLLFLSIPVFASEIEVQPTMISRSNEQDRVWAGTFQIVWNELIDKYIHNPIRFRDGTPFCVYELNMKDFTTSNLSEHCFYKYSGNITKNTAKNIKKAIMKKFNETSDILDSLNLAPGSGNLIIYAMLKKDFEFLNRFDKLGEASFGQNMTAKYFGINKNSDKSTKDNVKVLFYNSPEDFAVKLLTKDNDEVYLYKNGTNKAFRTLFLDMNLKTAKFKGNKLMDESDELKIPNIKFDVSKTFDELCNKRIMGTHFSISEAIETIKFNMDDKGVQLKSEAVIMVEKMALPQQSIQKPRYFYFDDTFVIFLKEKEKRTPYFALRVHDITKFQ